MSKIQKVLVCGDVEGHFIQLFKKINSVIEKCGPFHLVLCVGEFFGSDSTEWLKIKSGNIKAPLPVFILGPHKPEVESFYPSSEGCELAENIIYLGSKGVYSCESGLKIAYLSGREYRGKSSFTFSIEDIRLLESQLSHVSQIDILITSQWPFSVSKYASTPIGLPNPDKDSSQLISRLAFLIKPRYHFCGLQGTFYERLPYRNHKVVCEPTKHATRFVALAKIDNKEKQKWIYAFNIVSTSSINTNELLKQPPDITECPYSAELVAKTEIMNEKASKQFFYDMESKCNDQSGRKRRHQSDGEKKLPELQGSCWFCLASPDVEKHLVISVGEHTYLALAKGGLIPQHLLILPIKHIRSSPDLDEDSRNEIEKFKRALKAMFSSLNKEVVFFERNYMSHHLQLQVVPVSSKAIELLKHLFIRYAETRGLDLVEVPERSEIYELASSGVPFFYVELSNGQKLFHRVKKRFPFQFGREVLADKSVLNVPERIDWKECVSSKSQEEELRDKVRERFKSYDFTLDDDEDSDN